MTQEAVTRDTLLKRLKRAEGQIRGIEKMIEEGRACEEVVIQLAAVRSAVEGIASLILSNYVHICFRDKTALECIDIESLARAIAIWGRVHVGDKHGD